MSILGNRWAFALLVAAFVGTTRFSDFAGQLGAPPGFADRPAADPVAQRRCWTPTAGATGSPRRVGRCFPVILTALQWAQRWFVAPEGPAVRLTHTACGTAFDAALTCDQCAPHCAEIM